MDEEFGYRAAMVDSFLQHLRRLTPAQLTEIVSAHRVDDAFYDLALELAGDATRLVGADRAPQYDVTLRSRLSEVERIVPAEPESSDRRGLVALAKGAVQALLVRDIASFNAGAFAELIGPFARHIALADLEFDARSALQRDAAR